MDCLSTCARLHTVTQKHRAETIERSDPIFPASFMSFITIKSYSSITEAQILFPGAHSLM